MFFTLAKVAKILNSSNISELSFQSLHLRQQVSRLEPATVRAAVACCDESSA